MKVYVVAVLVDLSLIVNVVIVEAVEVVGVVVVILFSVGRSVGRLNLVYLHSQCDFSR